MRKLKLSIDALQVDSFDATSGTPVRGTVAGRNWTEYADESCFGTCDGMCTRDASCAGGCGSGASCYGTCYNTCGNSCGGTCDHTCGGCTTAYTACDCQTIETCPGASICS